VKNDFKPLATFFALFLFSSFIAMGECAGEAGTAAPVNTPFQPVLMGLLERYEGTREPLLPELENRNEIERETSVVPGRMHMPRSIAVNKEKCRLYLYNAMGDTLLSFPVCSSRNRGQKSKKDDWRTPEGTFKMYGVYNSSDWTYEDTDDKCYGPFFLSLKTQRYWGIGIHGTNAPGSVPGRRSHGCMRLHNDNITVLKGLVTKDLLVTILPDSVAPENQ